MIGYKATMGDILKDCTKKLKLVEKYYAEEDLKNYAIEAHSVKSVSASIGAKDFSVIAREHEHKAKENNLDFIKANGEEFIKKYHEFLNAIADILKEEEECENDTVSEENVEVKKYTDREIKAIINDAIAALKDFETDLAGEHLEKLMTQKDNADLVEKIYQAQEKIDDFEYEEAEEIMKSLL